MMPPPPRPDSARPDPQRPEGAVPPPAPPRRPGFGDVLVHWFWDTFDHMGRLLVLNLALFLATAPVAYAVFLAIELSLREQAGALVLVGLVAVALAILQLGPLTLAAAGLLHVAGRISDEKDPPLADFVRGIWQVGRPVAAVMAVWVAASTVLLVNAWFYIGPLRPTWLPPLGGAFLAGLCVWLALGGLGVVGHALVLAARSRHGLWARLRLGLLLTLKYPGLTAATVLFAASLLVIGARLWGVGLLLWGFTAPVLLMNALHDVIADYEDDLARPPLPPATTWAERQAREAEEEERRLRRARYQRTFRDVIRPWEE